jgi:hypothetical protein
MLVDKKASLNLQDSRGNSGLHYVIISGNSRVLKLIFESYTIKKKYICQSEMITSPYHSGGMNINPNITNMDGLTVCHILLYKYLSENDNYIDTLIDNMNVNLQDNKGNTILHLVANRNLWNVFPSLRKKKLGLYIRNNSGKTVIELSNSTTLDNIVDIATDGYIRYLKKHQDKWVIDWQNKCSATSYTSITEDNCREYIRDAIKKEQSPIPLKKNKQKIVIYQNKNVMFSTFVGENIEIVTGMIYLKKKYNDMMFIINPASDMNSDLVDYYNCLGIVINTSKMIASLEISWVYQRLFFPSGFEEFIKETIDSGGTYIVVPLEIILSNGGHSNILIINFTNMVVERFDPHGSGYPLQFNYNPTLLDTLLEKKIKFILSNITDANVTYKAPIDYLPHIGFQTLDQMEISVNKNIGDPSGFCMLWCIWYMDYRIKHLSLPSEKLVSSLIKNIRKDNLSFRGIIRNYSKVITDIRDTYLSNIGKDINDVINNRLSQHDVNTLYNTFTQSIYTRH